MHYDLSDASITRHKFRAGEKVAVSENARVRSTPTTEIQNIVATVQGKQEATILEEFVYDESHKHSTNLFSLRLKHYVWFKVKLENGTTGYIASGLLSPIDVEEEPVIATGTSKGVNVRQGPSGSTEKLGYISKGETVEIVAEEGSYYKVKYNGGYGYVYGTYIELEEKDLPVTAEGISKGVNVRQSPSGSSEKLGYISKGERVEIVEEAGSYYKVKYNGGYGYVYGIYIELEEEELPVIAEGISKGVNVRQSPSGSSEKLGYISKGETVEIVEEARSYYKVKYNGGYGYVYGTYIELEEELPVIAEGISKGVNVRLGPSSSTEKLGYISSGEAVEIVEEEGSYYKVKYNGGYGYVYGTYIEIKEKVIAEGTSKGVNVRQGPSGSTEKLGYLSSGETVEIVEEEGSYYKVKYNDSYGYVYGLYVDIIE
jgi:uncharacterized protein YgiM (DUF1202 family)